MAGVIIVSDMDSNIVYIAETKKETWSAHFQAVCRRFCPEWGTLSEIEALSALEEEFFISARRTVETFWFNKEGVFCRGLGT